MNNNIAPCLETLFNTLSRDQFLQSYTSNTPVVSHGNLEKIQDLTSNKLLHSLDNLLEIWPHLVNSYLPGIKDEVNSIKLSTKDAKESYEKGRALFFDDVEINEPIIKYWLDSIKNDLGLSNLTYSRALIYALPKNGSTTAHFDQNINFVLQVSGTKKWWIAPNEEIVNPLTRHTMGTKADPELSSYLRQELPDHFPENAKEYTLEPGSILFVPRGAWHKTEALSDSVALNFTYSAPTWIDILTTALRGRLAQSPNWRATADFVTDEVLHQEAISEFDLLLKEIAQDVPTWKARDILGATEC